MTKSGTPKFATGDCHIGDCQRPADHKGKHGTMTPAEGRTYAARQTDPAALTRWTADIFDDAAWT